MSYMLLYSALKKHRDGNSSKKNEEKQIVGIGKIMLQGIPTLVTQMDVKQKYRKVDVSERGYALEGDGYEVILDIVSGKGKYIVFKIDNEKKLKKFTKKLSNGEIIDIDKYNVEIF